MRRACLFGTSLLLVLLTPSARAADKEAQEERAARKACLSGDYAKGVEILSDLFLDTKNPTYIFNQARCYEQNNHCSEALGRFREYLRTAPRMSVSERTEVERHIQECEAVLKQNTSSITPGPAVQPPLSPAMPASDPAAAPATPVDASVPPPAGEQATTTAPARKGYGLLIAGVCTGAVGLGSMGVGIYYYARARDFSNKASQPGANRPSIDADGKHAENMQWIFFGLGGVALATGAVLTVLGWPSSQPSTPSTSFAPMVGPGLAGFAAQGIF